MSAASNAAALPDQPDPLPDRAPEPAAVTAPPPRRTGRLLGLLRKLVDYGKDLAHTLQQRTAATALFAVALNFGTRDITLILARITRGLRLANALEARMVSHPPREVAASAPVPAPSDRAQRVTKPAERRAGRAAAGLALVPTAEEIAAALRHRSAAAVIADICRDLGIAPAHPLWGEVMTVLAEHGVNIVALVKSVADNIDSLFADVLALTEDEWPAGWSQAAAACGTGPP
jgi:hypothetical protein